MTTAILEQIDSPADVQALDYRELSHLAEQIRSEIVHTMSFNGGHLATNLGSVELSLALHYVLDSPRDKIIWDVGNQCYTHKLITGRRAQFSTIRKDGGLSGFVHRGESAHDHLTAGHSSTALSAAIGVAAARDLTGDHRRVVAVVGDGAMSAGLSYEALNNLGTFNGQMLLMLNDNDYSIGSSCGALARTLRQASSRILDGNLFEKLGIKYLGPIDGHDLPMLVETLRDVVRLNKPVVLHVLTKKGKGFAPAEMHPDRFHGVGAFDVETGAPTGKASPMTYSGLFGEEMIRIAESDSRVVAISAAMIAGTGLSGFAKHFPDRCFDVGIAEQHAVTFAAGLAIGNCRPVVAIYSTFLQRGFDQVLHDVCLQDLPVTFVLDRAGLTPADGPTHHGLFDIAFLRGVPRMVIMTPKDGEEFKRMLAMAVGHSGPTAIRIPRSALPEPLQSTRETTPVAIGRGECLRDGNDVALFAIGSMVPPAMEAATELERHGVSAAVVNARFVKPLDRELLLGLAGRVQRVYTLEEHVRMGGFGSAVMELFSEHDVSTPVTALGMPDQFIPHGSAKRILDECGLSTLKIVDRVLAQDPSRASRPRIQLVGMNEQLSHDAIQRIHQAELPEELAYWVGEYAKVGDRDAFLWKWCLEGVRLTTLSCVDSEVNHCNHITKVLGVLLDVLMDDVADQGCDEAYLEQILGIPFAATLPDDSALPESRRRYIQTTVRVWQAIVERVRTYPRYERFKDLLRFDYMQLLNAMRYSHMVNRDPRLLNLVEHDLYLPHNMHMMVSGTMDLMCSPEFDEAELGQLREVLWSAQCMGRVGNLVTTWERELADADFSSGVFAHALHLGVLNSGDLSGGNAERIRAAITSAGCESYFLQGWHEHRDSMLAVAKTLRSIDVAALVDGLEKLLAIHLGSRGLK